MEAAFHACFALQQVFINQRGEVRACCMAQNPLAPSGSQIRNAWPAKVSNNLAIIERNDASACWGQCPARNPVPKRPEADVIKKIVVDTNTFCPARCLYCSQAYAAHEPEWGSWFEPSLASGQLGKWATRAAGGQLIAPVRVPAHRQQNLLQTLRVLVEAHGDPSSLWVECTGGDSAYHPEFRDSIEWLIGAGVRVIYLSSGLVPSTLVGSLLELVESGRFFITVSTDSCRPETWSRIKRKPAALFNRVLDFLGASAERQKTNQVAVKFIVMKENLSDAADFVPFYAGGGLKKFVVSACRAQPVFFVPPPAKEEVQLACKRLFTAFEETPQAPEAELVIDGLETHFQDRSSIRKSDLLFSLT